MNSKCEQCNAKRICDYFDGQYGPNTVCDGEPIIAPRAVRGPTPTLRKTTLYTNALRNKIKEH